MLQVTFERDGKIGVSIYENGESFTVGGEGVAKEVEVKPKEVLSKVTLRREHGPAAKLAFEAERTRLRHAMLWWTFEARRLNLRTANRRYRRRNGLSFKGV